MTRYEFWNIAIQAVIAVGTLIVTLLAIFGQTIRRWFFRPKLKIEVGIVSPFLELCKVDSDSASAQPSSFSEARVKITNFGKDTARNCKVVVDTVYDQRGASSDLYPAQTFLPRPFTWDNDKESVDLLSGIPSYILILRIAGANQTTKEESGAQQEREVQYSLILLIAKDRKGILLNLTKGKHVFPFTLYADNIPRPIKKYIEVFWDGDSPEDTTPAHYAVRMHDEKSVAKLIGGDK